MQQQRYSVAVTGGSIEVLIDQLACEHSEGRASAGPRINLLCLHGWTLDSRSFNPQLALVSSQLQLVRYDRRGFGRNTLPPCFQTELDDLPAIMRSLSGSVVLWGVSQGARLALRYWVAATAAVRGSPPEAVARAIATGTTMLALAVLLVNSLV